MNETNNLKRTLQNCKTLAIVGLSDDPSRPSYMVAKYMQDHGFRIIPVNPKCDEILGERCYSTLSDIPLPIDLVDVFRKSADVLPIAEEAIAIGAKTLWLQIGVVNGEAQQKAEAAGLNVFMDLCIKIEHMRLLTN